MVVQLVKEKKLNNESYLIKDGSIEYKKIGTDDYRDLSAIKSNYRCVVVSQKLLTLNFLKINAIRLWQKNC